MPAVANTIVNFICDNPRCGTKHGKISAFTWSEEKARRDASTLPDEFSYLVKIHPDPFNADHFLLFCGVICARDYLQYTYVRPKSPRQLKQEADEKLKVNPAAQEAIDEALAEGYKANAEFDCNNQMVLPFGEPTEFAAQTVEAVEDSTGYPN